MSFLLLTLACYSAEKSDNYDRYDPEQNQAEEEESDGSVWSANLQNNPLDSSSRLDLSWSTAEDDNINHFRLEVIDQVTGDSEYFQLDPSQSQVTIENRKANTAYSIDIEACMDDACSLRVSVQENQIEAETKTQRWMIQGTSLETMPILSENVGLFSAGSFGYQSNSGALKELWVYQDGVLESYAQTEYDSWDEPVASCWDDSCFTDIQQLHITSTSVLILDSDNTIYAQNSDSFDACPDDCTSEILYSSTEDIFTDFFYDQEQEVIFWEGISVCQDEAIFLAHSTDNIWRSQLNAEGCPKAISHSAESPRLVSTENHDLLYFQQMGEIQYLYAKDDITQWEEEETARTLSLEWENGTEINLDDIRIGRLGFGSSEQLYFSFQPAEMSSEQYPFLSVASLVNP